MYAMNRVYSLYPEQVNRCIFNFLDTHDTMRARNRCGSTDVVYQQLTLLMTLPGTACIYYGTEIAMEGGHDPDCRRPMPWEQIDTGLHNEAIEQMKALIALRKQHPQVHSPQILWHFDPARPRLVCYDRCADGKTLRIFLNAGTQAQPVPEAGALCYSRHYREGMLAPGGIAAVLLSDSSY